MDIFKFGQILFTRAAFNQGATLAYDLFATDKPGAEKQAELKAFLHTTVTNLEAAGEEVLGALVPIPGAQAIVTGLINSAPVATWVDALLTHAAENIVAAVRPIFHLQATTPTTPTVAP